MARASLSSSEPGADLSAWLAKIMAQLNGSTAPSQAICITSLRCPRHFHGHMALVNYVMNEYFAIRRWTGPPTMWTGFLHRRGGGSCLKGFTNRIIPKITWQHQFVVGGILPRWNLMQICTQWSLRLEFDLQAWGLYRRISNLSKFWKLPGCFKTWKGIV